MMRFVAAAALLFQFKCFAAAGYSLLTEEEARVPVNHPRRLLLQSNAEEAEDQPQCSLFETDDSPPSPPVS